MKGQNIIIAGVGGQGVILAGNILGLAAMKQGFDVKKTDTLGMAQRGGSVVSHLRYGEKVFSPSIKKGDADVIIAFSVHIGTGEYPGDAELTAIMKQKTDNICIIDAGKRAEELGNPHLINTILLGSALPYLSIKKNFLKKAIMEALPQKVVELNLKALEKGLEPTPS